jgi:hypothetical protein
LRGRRVVQATGVKEGGARRARRCVRLEALVDQIFGHVMTHAARLGRYAMLSREIGRHHRLSCFHAINECASPAESVLGWRPFR